MPERRLLEGQKSIAYDNQQLPWKLPICIQDGVCATYVLQILTVRLMCKRPNVRIYGYSGCYAAIPPTAPTNKTTLAKLPSPFFRS